MCAMEAHVPSVEILGVRVATMGADRALAEIEGLVEAHAASTVFYANAHTINVAAADPSFRNVLNEGSLVLNDGSGVALAARIQRRPFPENLNGSDFNSKILSLAARRGWPVFFLGGSEGVSARAARELGARIAGLRVVGSRHGYFSEGEAGPVAAAVRAAGARIVMVAMGNPLQEKWLSRHLPDTGASLGIGVGAFFDFSAGEVQRAPSWMNRAGLEWIYRLKLEPARMWRRYLLGNPLFVARVLRDWARRKRASLAN
jgi:exopolysaccharide biosynthesis WecB/TagA/CpsF family protein